MAFNYSKLKGRIVEKFGTQARFALEMEWSERTLSLKLTGQVPWKQTDIVKASRLLDISEEEIPAYFFTMKVQRAEL